jgi:hypothetical protein
MPALCRGRFHGKFVVEVCVKTAAVGAAGKRSGACAPLASIENARHSDSNLLRAGSSGMRTSMR